MKKHLNNKEIGLLLHKYIVANFEPTSMTARERAAIHYDVSPGYLSQVCTGGKGPNAQMLKDLGYIKIKSPTKYQRVEK